MQEIWKDIKGYEGLYQASNQGNIKSLKHEKEFILKQTLNNTGYLQVKLSKNGVTHTYNVHKLIAICFLKATKGKNYINHIDGNKQNNNSFNLEYCTQKENIRHSHINGLSNPFKKKILQLDENSKIIAIWDSIKEAGEKTKINRQNINACCKGKRKTAGNYIWEYADTN